MATGILAQSAPYAMKPGQKSLFKAFHSKKQARPIVTAWRHSASSRRTNRQAPKAIRQSPSRTSFPFPRRSCFTSWRNATS